MNLLNEIGFSWEPRDFIWQQHYQELLDYKKMNGNSNVPQGYSDKRLVTWVLTQRNYRKKQKLSYDKIKLLNEIGFSGNHSCGK